MLRTNKRKAAVQLLGEQQRQQHRCRWGSSYLNVKWSSAKNRACKISKSLPRKIHKDKKAKHTNSVFSPSSFLAQIFSPPHICSWLLLCKAWLTHQWLLCTTWHLLLSEGSIISSSNELPCAQRAAERRQSSIKRWDMANYHRNRQAGRITGRPRCSKPFVQQFSFLLIVSPTSAYLLPLQIVC